MKEHTKAIFQGDTKTSALADHYATKHVSQEIPAKPFTGKIIERARDSADLLIREATQIRIRKPEINRDKGWANLANSFSI